MDTGNTVDKKAPHIQLDFLFRILSVNMGKRLHLTDFQTGGNSDQDNYRSITITSNIGKLFTIILNSRLDKFVEDNQYN